MAIQEANYDTMTLDQREKCKNAIARNLMSQKRDEVELGQRLLEPEVVPFHFDLAHDLKSALADGRTLPLPKRRDLLAIQETLLGVVHDRLVEEHKSIKKREEAVTTAEARLKTGTPGTNGQHSVNVHCAGMQEHYFAEDFIDNFNRPQAFHRWPQQTPMPSLAPTTPSKALLCVLDLLFDPQPNQPPRFTLKQASTNLSGKFCGEDIPAGDIVLANMTTIAWSHSSDYNVVLIELLSDRRRFDIVFRAKDKPTVVMAGGIDDLIGAAEVIKTHLEQDPRSHAGNVGAGR